MKHIQNKKGRFILSMTEERMCMIDISFFTLARILGSTATTSDKHFMAFVRTAIAFSPSTRRI